MEAAITAGLDVDRFAPRISFFFNSHSDFLTEVAKFRAARRLYAKIMRERFGAKTDRACMLRFHTQTAGSTLTAQQPEVNVVRTAYQALAAVLGGTQSLHTNSKDEALGLPTEESATLALRTQQVIACETGVIAEADPLGGSYYIEALTDRIESEAVEYLARIDAMGGTLQAIEQGYVQGEIQNAAYVAQLEIESGKQIIVGVNRFQAEKEVPVPVFRIDPAVERHQTERVRAVRASRNAEVLQERLQALEAAARGTENLMPHILASAEAMGTVGEISDVLRKVFGEYRETGL